MAVNPSTDHLLVASAGPVDVNTVPLGYGTLSVLDMRQGMTLQHIGLGVMPVSIFADKRADHLFILNANTDMAGHSLTVSYPDGEWARTLRWLKSSIGWLPFKAPALPPPPTNGTVMMFDLAQL